MVAAFHRAGLAAGGTDNGGPGERRYHPSCDAAFLLDPDGNNIEAVFPGEASRSAESMRITFWRENPAAGVWPARDTAKLMSGQETHGEDERLLVSASRPQ